jgi:hypothetical protein
MRLLKISLFLSPTIPLLSAHLEPEKPTLTFKRFYPAVFSDFERQAQFEMSPPSQM